MEKLNINSFKEILNSFYISVFPTKRDNIGQIILKTVFLISLILLIIFFSIVSVYFSNINYDQALLTKNKQTFSQFTANDEGHYDKALKYFKKENSDLKGWISIPQSDLSAPIYQTDNNNFYLSHNQLKQKSKTGTLFFDCKDIFSNKDKNLVVYGKNKQQLFSCLQNYKSIYYYLQNPIIKLSTANTTNDYIIFSAFVINSNTKDDGNYIFNYKKSTFKDDTDFQKWYNEITERSLYTTDISVSSEDDLLTLVTDTVEFKGAKLVIMARKIQDNENLSKPTIKINKNPRYPQIYYNIKGIKNPFNTKEE